MFIKMFNKNIFYTAPQTPTLLQPLKDVHISRILVKQEVMSQKVHTS